MRLKEFIYLFSKSFNPLNYKMLVTRKKRDTMKYFLYLLFFAIIIGGLFSIPKLMHFPERLEGTLSKFEKFNITGLDIESKEPITLLDRPNVVLDLSPNRTQLEEETVLITQEFIFIRRLDPSLLDLRLYRTEQRPVEEYSDVLQSANRIKSAYLLFFILILPSLFFIIYILNFVKYSLLILTFTLLGFLLMKLRKKRAHITKTLRAAVFSITPMILLEISISPLFNLGIIPFIIYIILFISGISLMMDTEIKIKNDQKER